jgi:Domain of unknown function (DUF4234)
MNRREVSTVIILSIVTLGIYTIIWLVMTRNEMQKFGVQTVHPLLMFVPIAGPFILIYFLWQYAGGVQLITKGKISQAVAFMYLFRIGAIGLGVLQEEFNQIGEGGSVNTDPFATR